MKLTPLRAIKKHQPRLDVESRRVVWNVRDTKKKKCGNARLPIVFCLNIDWETILKERELELQKICTQRWVLTKRCKGCGLRLEEVGLFGKWKLSAKFFR